MDFKNAMKGGGRLPLRRGELFAILFLICAGTVAGLALAEGALRLAGFSYPAFHAMDELTGYRLKPGAEGWYRNEGRAYIRINSAGWRDRERARSKPADTYRIAVLGDSFAEALQVPMEATFWAHLERQLNRCKPFGRKHVEVLNFGVSNYGTAQELLTLRHRVWDYSPDMVLLAFLPSNDVRNNSRTLEPGRNRPFFELQDGQLRLDKSFADDPGWQQARRLGEQREFLAKFRVYQLLRKLRAGSYRGWNDAPAAASLAKGQASVSLREVGIDERVFRAPQDAAWQEAWALTESLIGALRHETAARGAQFAVAVLSSGPAVYPDKQLRKRYMAALGLPDLFYPERRLQSLGAAHGFDVIALGPRMQAHADATGAFLHGFPNTQLGFGHWNQAGHELAGEIIGRELCARRPVQPAIL